MFDNLFLVVCRRPNDEFVSGLDGAWKFQSEIAFNQAEELGALVFLVFADHSMILATREQFSRK